MRRTFLAPLSLALRAALSLPAGAHVSNEMLESTARARYGLDFCERDAL